VFYALVVHRLTITDLGGRELYCMFMDGWMDSLDVYHARERDSILVYIHLGFHVLIVHG
jgi:hypothetical protein